MAKNVVINVQVNSNIDEQATKLKNFGADVKETTAEIEKSTKATKSHTQAVLDNGGAVGLLNDLTGGWAGKVKDAFEALELFTSAKKADTVVTEAATVATVSNNTATQLSILGKIKNAAGWVANTVGAAANAVATAAATAAQWLWNSAILANPLVAFVAAIIGAGVAIYKLTTFLIDSSKASDSYAAATKRLTKDIEDNQKAAEKANDAFELSSEHQYNLAKANGASSEELRKLSIQLAIAKIKQEEYNAVVAAGTVIRARQAILDAQAAGASEEVISGLVKVKNEAFKNLQEQNANVKAAGQEYKKIVNKNEEEVAQEKTNARKKEADAQTKANEDRKKKEADAQAKAKDERKKQEEDDAKERLEDEKTATKDIIQQRVDLMKEGVDKELAAEKAAHEQRILDIKELNLTDETRKELLANEELLFKQHNEKIIQLEKDRIAEVNKTAAAAQLEKTQTQLDLLGETATNEDLSFEERRNALQEQNRLILESTVFTEAQRTAALKANGKARMDLDKAEAENRKQLLANGANALKQASEVLGEATAVGKATAIAAATINTYQAATAAYASLAGIPIVGPALGAVAAGVAIAAGIVNVKKIIAVKTPKGDAGGTAPTAEAPAGASSVVTPIVPRQVTLFGRPNELNNSTAPQSRDISEQTITVNAVVSESEMTNTQTKIKQIQENSELGG